MPDDAFADRDPRLDMTLPTDGWVYVRVGGEVLTAFSVDTDENLEVFVEDDQPKAALDRTDGHTDNP